MDKPGIGGAARVATRLLEAMASGHPYGEAILGDLAEGHADVSARCGREVAQRWYRAEVWRSLLALVLTVRITPRLALRLLALVLGAYAIAVRAPSPAVQAIERVIHAGQQRWLLLLMVSLCGAMCGAVVGRWGRPAPLEGSLLLWALALAVGAVHVGSGVPAEVWFRAGKVALFLVGICAGSAAVLLRLPVRNLRPT